MNQARDVDDLIEQVVAESQLPAGKRDELRKELKSHMWETGSELQKQGVAEKEIPAAIQARFGMPKNVGRSFSLIYGSFHMRFVKPSLIMLGALLLIFMTRPWWGTVEANGKYYTFLHDKFGDEAWYGRAVTLAAAKEQGVEPQDAKCAYRADGDEMRYFRFWSILTLCHERWLILKMLPPIQISGPRVSMPDVIEAMRQARALRNEHSVFDADPLNAIAARALETYLESLALGAGRTKTKAVTSPGRPFASGVETGLGSYDGLNYEEYAKMGLPPLKEMRGFPTAALYWAGDTEQLRKWNTDVAPDDLPKLLAAACTRQMHCLMPLKIETVSVEKKADSAVVTLRAFLDAPDEKIANRPFLFEVTRFDIGTKNDWTDDEYNVTRGFAFRS